MQLGAFSLSLTSRTSRLQGLFTKRWALQAFMGKAEQGWLILRNGSCVIGLFQGMLAQNTFTFNPWDFEARELPDFTDLRDLQRELQARGAEPRARSE